MTHQVIVDVHSVVTPTSVYAKTRTNESLVSPNSYDRRDSGLWMAESKPETVHKKTKSVSFDDSVNDDIDRSEPKYDVLSPADSQLLITKEQNGKFNENQCTSEMEEHCNDLNHVAVVDSSMIVKHTDVNRKEERTEAEGEAPPTNKELPDTDVRFQKIQEANNHNINNELLDENIHSDREDGQSNLLKEIREFKQKCRQLKPVEVRPMTGTQRAVMKPADKLDYIAFGKTLKEDIMAVKGKLRKVDTERHLQFKGG